MSITIDVSDDLLAELGKEKIEQEIIDSLKLLSMKQRQAKRQRMFTDGELKELLDGLDEIDLSSDPAYQKAREDAWKFYTELHNLTPDGARKH